MGKSIQRNVNALAKNSRSDMIVLESQIRVKIMYKFRVDGFLNMTRYSRELVFKMFARFKCSKSASTIVLPEITCLL